MGRTGKRILLCANYYLPHRDGVANYAAGLAAALKKRGHEVKILTFDTEQVGPSQKIDGIPVVRLPCRNVLGGTYTLSKKDEGYRKTISGLIAERFDAIITNTRFFPMTWLGGHLARRMRTRWIHVEHGNRHVKHQNPFVALVAWLVDETLGKRVFTHAAVTVGIAPANVAFARRMGAKKTIYIPNAIDTKAYAKDAKAGAALRKQLGIGTKEKVVVFVGRLGRMKGVHDLINAMRGLDATLLIVGDGPERARLEAQARRAKIKAHFLGEQDTKGVIAALSAADAFANPSYSEGMPTSVLEAAATGLPVAATDVGGTAEIVGKDGLLVRPGDVEGLRKAVTEALAAKRRTYRLARFTWQRSAKRFAELLDGEEAPSVRFVLPLRRGGARTAGETVAHALRKRGWDIRITGTLLGYLATLFSPRAEIIHTLLPFPFRLWRKPFLLHLHGDYRRERSWRNPLSWFYPSAIRRAAIVVTPSEHLCKELGIGAEIIPNIVEPNAIPRQAHDCLTLLTVTNFAFREKAEGVIKILDALQTVKPRIRVTYRIAGDGPELARVRREAKRISLDPHIAVEFLGHRDDVPTLLATADIFLYWSTQDTFGLAVAEAMAAGLPVVVNDYGPFRELVTDRKDGFLTKSREAFARHTERLVGSPRLRKRIGSAAVLASRQWTEEQVVCWWEQTYARVSDNT